MTEEYSKYNDLNILITGGAGFIGSHIAKELVRLGSNVEVFDNFSTGRMMNLDDIKDSITVLDFDIRDYEAIKKAVKDKDIIFHAAADTIVSKSVENPLYNFCCNAQGTVHVLDALRELGSSAKLIFASSAAVYGEAEKTPTPEDSSLRPTSPYGLSKLIGEHYCEMFHELYGIQTVILRYFNVYGPFQSCHVMYDLLKKLHDNPKKLEVLGSGGQIRDFVYISDCVNMSLLLGIMKEAVNGVFNIASGKGIRIRDLTNLILSLLDLDGKTEVHYTGESWRGDAQILLADVTKTENLGLSPKVELIQGLRSVISWFQSINNHV